MNNYTPGYDLIYDSCPFCKGSFSFNKPIQFKGSKADGKCPFCNDIILGCYVEKEDKSNNDIIKDSKICAYNDAIDFLINQESASDNKEDIKARKWLADKLNNEVDKFIASEKLGNRRKGFILKLARKPLPLGRG